MPAPTIDGSSVTGTHSGGGSLTTAGLTTTQTNDIIIVMSSVEGNSSATPNVTGVTGGSLTFALRARAANVVSSGGPKVEIWWALAPGTLSSVAFTISYSATYDDAAAIAFGVHGCYTTAPWDGNASLPKLHTANAQPASFPSTSTTNANDLILMALGTATSIYTYTEPSGFTQIGDVQNSGGSQFAWGHVSRMAVTTPQSNVTFTSGTIVSGVPAGIIDALTADGSSAALTSQYAVT